MKRYSVLVIDNYGPSTSGLVQDFRELGADIDVYKNNKISVEQIAEPSPDRIVLSPGPGLPADAGITKKVVEKFNGKIPILGICLGHHAIGEVFGAEVVETPEMGRAIEPQIHHDKSLLFKGIYSSFHATRCDSLILKKETIPESIRITAWTEDGFVMGIQVIDTLTLGIQFHPEYPLTPKGLIILKNFLNCRAEGEM